MENTFLKKLDPTILFLIGLLGLISIIALTSTQAQGLYGSSNLAMKQGINFLVGAVLLLIFSYLDLDQIEGLAWPLYIFGFVTVAVIPFMPASIVPPVLGAKRWFNIPFLGSIQPSEFVKVFLLILNARIAQNHNTENPVRTVKSDLKLVGKIMLSTLPVFGFVYIEPDTGMPFLYLAGSLTIIFLSGIQKKVILPIILIPIGLLSIIVVIYFQSPSVFNSLLHMLSPHQQARITGWISPSANSASAYQTQKSLLAVGTGETVGKGLGNLKSDVYIPEKTSDFIFSSIAESGGFLAASIVISLYFMLMYRVTVIGLNTKSSFGSYLCGATIVIFSLQIFQNIGMTIGLMPVKGISLPFLSYGGSSIFSNMILMGIFLSMNKTYKKYMFGQE
jgi:cell division protein FtsW (lipid II flippase)